MAFSSHPDEVKGPGSFDDFSELVHVLEHGRLVLTAQAEPSAVSRPDEDSIGHALRVHL